MKLNYFNDPQADDDDMALNIAKTQGYVPQTCLQGGTFVMSIINSGISKDPCKGCECDRLKCNGRPKEEIKSKKVRKQK
jgi:hypothetical protein